jgi:hypothetical protein
VRIHVCQDKHSHFDVLGLLQERLIVA